MVLQLSQLMALYAQSPRRLDRVVAADAGLAVPYDAYRVDQQPQQQQPSPPSNQPLQHQHQTHHQPWYDVSDGALTPPDDSTSHSRLQTTGATKSHVISRCTSFSILIELSIVVSLAVTEYFLRATNAFTARHVTFSCFDADISVKMVHNSTVHVNLLSTEVPREALIFICFCLPPFVICLCELVLWSISRHAGYQSTLAIGRHCHCLLPFRRILRFTGSFVFGFLVTMVFVDTAKVMVGRLRPTFLDVCQPNWTRCEMDASQFELSSSDVVCQQLDALAIEEARKSFPSMYAAVSAFTAVFMAVYIHNTLCAAHKVCVLRPFLSLLFIFLSTLCCFVNLAEHYNHWTDIVAGYLFGVLLSVYLSVFILNNFHERTFRSRLERDSTSDDLDDGKTGSSPSGSDWRCMDSTSAKSWNHYTAVHLPTPHLHTAVVHKLHD